MQIILDAESDGLLDTVTKLHCISYEHLGNIVSTSDYDEMIDLLSRADTIIGHNIICFDMPVFKKILGVNVKARLIDTLALSWYLFPNRRLHGIESWGEDFGIPKPVINNWVGLTTEEYFHRCEEDVKITKLLWNKCKEKLLDLYGSREEADRLINYLAFKLDCLREQEASGWKLDVDKARHMIEVLAEQQEIKLNQLIGHMPKRSIFVSKTKPAKPYKKDGSWSSHGANWFSLLRERGLPEDYNGEVQVLVREEDANPNSSDQVKDWLFSLGWEPREFKFVKDADGSERTIPQVRVEGELSPSVLELVEDNPGVAVLDGLTVIQHRLGIFKAFVEN